MSWEVRQGDALERLREMPDESVQCCVTSPPYWGLRDYGSEEQLGLEPTPEEFVANLVAVFAEVRRALRDDGTLWLNLGDSYAGRADGARGVTYRRDRAPAMAPKTASRPSNCKNKDLVGIPWMVAFALRADGWYLRSDIIWAKPNPMPESVTDRPTKAHEYLFLLTKSPRYFYNADAICEPATFEGPNGAQQSPHAQGFGRRSAEEEQARRVKRRSVRPGVDTKGGNQGNGAMTWGPTRNKRSVWSIPTKPYVAAHFATFPPALVEPCIRAGSAEGDTVLDPFCGAATTGLVAARLDRDFIGLELNPEYVDLGRNRIREDAPLLNTPTELAA